MVPHPEGRHERLSDGIREIVRLRELGPKNPHWNRAWKRLLWRYEQELHQEVAMLQAKEYRLGRSFLGRLPAEGEIIATLAEFCREEGVQVGWISAIGTFRRAVLGYFDQQKKEYQRIPVNEETEIVSCQGNISLKDGRPFVHLHALISGPDGVSWAGHLFEGTVFVGEFWLQEAEGPALERKPDPQSGLALWDME